ncbi:alpha/beta fold hydrolase [Flavobacterium cheonanense]|uniref:Alpha/beta fold hydrolase n=1 Tax=Flavobacterium cheonanense TaxID=706183 RepID=A0ABP7VI38_9FLAO
MKTKLLFTLLIAFSFSIAKAQNLIAKQKAVEVEINNQNLLERNSLTINQKLPYPIIFIHGLNSNSAVWTDLGTQLINSGLSFGGRIDFCLNDDGNNLLSNKNLYPTSGADIALYTDYNTDLSVADFYLLNFDIDNLGRLPSNANFTDVLSNEAAIAKQGVALKYAIQIVMQKTGRDKVILMGHSMGGLASREYLQNPINWQPDGNHHVAKLITTGTPHGGYTGTNAGLITGIDSQSEAYRDLRKEYSNSNNGVFLYGGIENSTTIGTNFYNNDINCNSSNNDNTLITGLNQKSLYNNLDYAYIIGVCTNCFLLQGTIEGDGIVRSVNANLSNFYTLPLPKNEFIYTASANSTFIGLHSDLPQAIPVSMQGLDEPNEYLLGYNIAFNQEYKGFITQQPVNGYPFDYDDYKFTMPSNGSFNISINNSFSNNLFFRILDTSLNQVYTNTVASSSTSPFTTSLNSGQYYLEFYSTPVSTSYQFPYTFTIQNTLSTDDNLVDNTFSIYPNPTNSKVNIKSESNFDYVEIYNVLGQKISSNTISSNQEIDMNDFPIGIYTLKISNEEITKSVKVIKQ